MIHPIVRIFETAQQATEAVGALRGWGFAEDIINVVGPSAARAASSGGADDALVAAITSGYVLKAHAKVYAEAVRRGGTLVSIRAPFGTGAIATEILADSRPLDAGIDDEDAVKGDWDDAAPMSSILHMPVRGGGATPLSTFWMLPVITRRGGTVCSALGFAELSSSATPLSSAVGMRSLSGGAAPLSSLFKLPLLY